MAITVQNRLDSDTAQFVANPGLQVFSYKQLVSCWIKETWVATL